MPYLKNKGFRFDRFSSKAEAHLICKLLKDFKVVKKSQVRKLKYIDKLIRDYKSVTLKDKKESVCTHGVFYDGKICKLPELKKRLKPILSLYSKKEIALYFKSLEKEKS